MTSKLSLLQGQGGWKHGVEDTRDYARQKVLANRMTNCSYTSSDRGKESRNVIVRRRKGRNGEENPFGK